MSRAYLCSFCLDTKRNQKNQEPNMLPARNAGPPPHLARANAPAENLVLHKKLQMISGGRTNLPSTPWINNIILSTVWQWHVRRALRLSRGF
jgi:hypothetical protein